MVTPPKVDRVIAWLLEPAEPAMRYLATRDLVPSARTRSSLDDLRRAIPHGGWAAAILGRQRERTWWETKTTCYWPKVRGTYWSLAVLADLGLTRDDERIANAVEHMLRLHRAPDGGSPRSVRPNRAISARRGSWSGPS